MKYVEVFAGQVFDVTNGYVDRPAEIDQLDADDTQRVVDGTDDHTAIPNLILRPTSARTP